MQPDPLPEPVTSPDVAHLEPVQAPELDTPAARLRAARALADGGPVPLAFRVAAIVQAIAGPCSVTVHPQRGPMMAIAIEARDRLTDEEAGQIQALVGPTIPAGAQVLMWEGRPGARGLGAVPLARALVPVPPEPPVAE